MRQPNSRFLLRAALSGALATGLPACGGNGSRTGTQTGDEGDTAHTTTTAATSSGGTASGGATTTGGESSAANSTTSAGGINTSSGSSSTGAGAGGASDGGATNDTSSGSGAGGAAGSETGSDGPLTGSTSGGGTAGGGGASGDDCSSDSDCNVGISCCDGRCVNLGNDVDNCGACGVVCEGAARYCAGNACAEAPCTTDTCSGGDTCCGTECCGAGELCCAVNLGPSVLGCFEPVNGTCPQGCPDCDCAAPDTPIATPAGERPIATLRVGDLVYSVDEHGVVVVPIVRINRVAVEKHHVMRVRLDDGTVLRISPRHPLFGSGVFGELGAGSTLGEKTVREAKPVAYDLPFTYDILPGSSSGAYFAGGALIGSTLAD